FAELDERGSIFGIPRQLFFTPDPAAPYRTALYGQALDTPFGVAAGPHSQMAQNIIAAFLHGARFIELKTIQTLDELNVSKPCIDMQDEGYNVEWSQELKIDQSFREYLIAWVLIHALHHKLGFAGAPGVIFNMSVGYNLEGILKPNVQGFLARMADAGPEFDEALDAVAAVYPAVRDLPIPRRLSDNVTLSTMHGCPPDEIGKIAAYLIEERGLHTNVKLNPTLLGPERLRGILNGTCGFRQVTVPDEAFGHDLKYPDAVKILTDLRARAAAKGVVFGVKLSNTLEVVNHRNVFSSNEKMMYLSGRPLQAVTVNLAATLAREFDGDLRMSYAGGADCWNVADLLACGMNTVTASSDLLRPGGYARLLQYVAETDSALRAAGASNLPAWICAKAGSPAGASVKECALANLVAYADRVLESPAYRRDTFDRRRTKTARPLTPFDCIAAPCTTTCPISQDVPAYMAAVAGGDFDKAAAIIRRDNPMAATLGRACNHACETTCIRSQYDQPLAIREIKRAALEYGTDVPLSGGAASSRALTVAIVGAGPCGLAAAAELAAAGVSVTVYDSHTGPGGMADQTLPSYRSLPELIQKDVARLSAAGVQFKFNQTAPRDFTLDSLRSASDAVIVATGAPLGTPMGIPGEDSQGVLDGIRFLRDVRSGALKSLSGTVAVVGGGDVAMDCARVAKRLGAAPVVVYRRTREEMPAHREELAGLLEEGIPVRELAAPLAVLASPEGRVAGLRCATMKLGEPDASGRRRPVPVPGADFDIPVSYIVSAIGQRPAADFPPAALPRNPKGWLVADPATGATALPGVYAGGDAVNNGPATLVAALADGRRIARAILGLPAVPSVPPVPSVPADLPATILKRASRARRVAPAERPLDDRSTFAEVVSTLSREDARAEARRCLQCDHFCSVCTSVCPNHAFLTYSCAPFEASLPSWTVENGKLVTESATPFAVRQSTQTAVLTDFCNECANCATFCPTAGRPYQDKPRLYASLSEFEAQTDNAFRIVGEKDNRSISGRFSGATHTLVPVAGGFEYKTPVLAVRLDSSLAPVDAPSFDAAFTGTADLTPAAILRTLLLNISPAQLPPVP
ncbi:MAG: FAD-dependent oxidoreductase, partial [Kiritimatiellae bacterium]|nr:FAD-dependent oxidoreductase [Kiritimatiellia bacterium]